MQRSTQHPVPVFAAVEQVARLLRVVDACYLGGVFLGVPAINAISARSPPAIAGSIGSGSAWPACPGTLYAVLDAAGEVLTVEKRVRLGG